MTGTKKAELKIDHVYRVVGPAMQNGWSTRHRAQFEALRYVGTMIPYRNGFADADNPVELFYSYAQRQHFLFKPGAFEAEELLD
jgi:hypothetical protein